MADIWFLLIIVGLLALPILWGMFRSKWNTNVFYGDEMNKKKNKRTLKDEAYEKSTSASQGQYSNDGPN